MSDQTSAYGVYKKDSEEETKSNSPEGPVQWWTKNKDGEWVRVG